MKSLFVLLLLAFACGFGMRLLLRLLLWLLRAAFAATFGLFRSVSVFLFLIEARSGTFQPPDPGRQWDVFIRVAVYIPFYQRYTGEGTYQGASWGKPCQLHSAFEKNRSTLYPQGLKLKGRC